MGGSGDPPTIAASRLSRSSSAAQEDTVHSAAVAAATAPSLSDFMPSSSMHSRPSRLGMLPTLMESMRMNDPSLLPDALASTNAVAAPGPGSNRGDSGEAFGSAENVVTSGGSTEHQAQQQQQQQRTSYGGFARVSYRTSADDLETGRRATTAASLSIPPGPIAEGTVPAASASRSAGSTTSNGSGGGGGIIGGLTGPTLSQTSRQRKAEDFSVQSVSLTEDRPEATASRKWTWQPTKTLRAIIGGGGSTAGINMSSSANTPEKAAVGT